MALEDESESERRLGVRKMGRMLRKRWSTIYDADNDIERDVEGRPLLCAYSRSCPLQSEVFESVAPSATDSVRKTIQDLDPDRSMGPPQQPGEEPMADATRCACWECKEDLDLMQEVFNSKRASFNSYIHAALPVVMEERQVVNDNYTNKHPEERSAKKSSGVKHIAPAVKEAKDKESAAYGEHPSFKLMLEDNQPGRDFRVARWEVHHLVLKKVVPKSKTLYGII
ncbi:hypothetical protein BGZ95_005174 [Linnemannia exigua]|uniref:Uncharacterized protein n=1 Tax=Linnemannia exigua TaxID=604196 RepID=A0AAD4H2P2_9FUNG|nr:hypothetical protein BGZ95_005174 [Linnemannia exigua]